MSNLQEEYKTSIEQKLKALDHFKDWSNYLLVTTVAALGWASTSEVKFSLPSLRVACGFCFAFSIVFGIFTLALLPLIAEQINDDSSTIYDFDVKYRILFLPKLRKIRLRYVCFFHHVLFILGILLYWIGTFF